METEIETEAKDEYKLTEVYDYDGLYYKVSETEAIHERLQTDAEFAACYFESKQAILISTSNENESSRSIAKNVEDTNLHDYSLTNDNHFKWDHVAIQLLLNEYLKLKEEFCDPTIKKSFLWSKIRDIFLEHGNDISIELLSTKFRNMKKTFLKIYHNNKTKTAGKENITWDYYNSFLEILKDDDALNTESVSRLSNPVLGQPGPSFRKIAPAPPGPSAATLALASALASSAASTKNNVMEKTPFNLRKAAKRKATLLKKKQKTRIKKLESEEKRVQEIQHLIYVIRENNNIQKERNVLLKELINKCKCNETIKLFM